MTTPKICHSFFEPKPKEKDEKNPRYVLAVYLENFSLFCEQEYQSIKSLLASRKQLRVQICLSSNPALSNTVVISDLLPSTDVDGFSSQSLRDLLSFRYHPVTILLSLLFASKHMRCGKWEERAPCVPKQSCNPCGVPEGDIFTTKTNHPVQCHWTYGAN